MRVLMVLVALVATPFLTSAAQGRSAQSPKADLKEARRGGEHEDEQRGDDRRGGDRRDRHGDGECKEKHANHGRHEGWRHGQHDDCDAKAPVLGGISGNVFFDMSYDGVRDADEPGIENWWIMLSGPVSATIATDAAGNYSFTGLPAGTYTVCEGQRFGWIQTAPQTESACASGLGYTIVITEGQSVDHQDFGNVG